MSNVKPTLCQSITGKCSAWAGSSPLVALGKIEFFKKIRNKKIDKCQAFICYNFDDYGLQLMKTPNSKSQKIRIDMN